MYTHKLSISRNYLSQPAWCLLLCIIQLILPFSTDDKQFQGTKTVAIAVGVTIPLVLIILAFTIPISIIAVQRYRKIKGSGMALAVFTLCHDDKVHHVI